MSILEAARLGQRLDDVHIIDSHAHFGRYEFPIADTSAGSIVQVMDHIGVRQVILSHMQCLMGHFRWANDEVLGACRDYPDRLLGYAVFWPGDADEVQREAKRCLATDNSFVGVKLHNVNKFPYTHPNYAPALAIANERRMPLLLHTWGNASEFDEIRQLSRKYPQLSIIAAHSGCSKIEAYIKVAQDCENVYLDTAWSRRRRGSIEREVREVGVHKILWGSDCYFFSMTQQIGSVAGLHLSDDDKRMILGGNARTMLERILK